MLFNFLYFGKQMDGLFVRGNRIAPQNKTECVHSQSVSFKHKIYPFPMEMG